MLNPAPAFFRQAAPTRKSLFNSFSLWCSCGVPARLANILFWAYIFFMVWGSVTAYNPADPDLWHRLALGEALWKTGRFPPGDAFSYLADYQNIADHEWGSAVVFYGLYRMGGEGAMVAIKIVTLMATMVFLIWAGTMNYRRHSVLGAGFYGIVMFALLPSFQSTVRCMTFTHLFFALWLYWFQRERYGRPVPAWAYVLTMILWANLHGGFVIGLGWLFSLTLLSFVIERPGWFGLKSSHAVTGFWSMGKWGPRLGLCALATLLNPFGIHLWVSTARALVAPRPGFPEWAPVSWWPNPLAYPCYKLLLFGVVLGLAALIYRRGWEKVDRPVILLVVLSILLSLTSARHTSLFAVVAGAFVPGILPFERRLATIANPIYRLGFMAIRSFLVILPLFLTLRVIPGDGLKLRYTDAAGKELPANPVKAVEYLQRNSIRGNLLIPFNYGSYALWELRGQMRVSMDGRYDLVYRPETYRRVDDFFSAKGNWRTLLISPAPNAILVPEADAVYPKLLEEPGWTEAWRNGTDAVFLPK